MNKFLLLSSLFIWQICSTVAQPTATPTPTGSELQNQLKNWGVTTSILYIAAHPDDENTRLITYLANEVGASTTYLSLTRGDGGQNLIGKEVREKLGILRTQELLAARRIDGGQQTFSRANDFGYSKHPDETFTIWDKEKVLADAVWAIRKYQPDIIITRFSPDRAGKTHGHHTASAVLALEAFHQAADPTKFPEQLDKVPVWQTKKIYWNTHWWFYGSKDNFNTTGLDSLDVGVYNPLLGKSYGEISSLSRSQHRCQGFGAALVRGTQMEYLEPLAGDTTQSGLLSGIKNSWYDIPNGKKVAKQFEKTLSKYEAANPAASIANLITLKTTLEALPDTRFKTKKLEELDQIILHSLGIWSDISTKDPSYTAGDSVKATIRIINRSTVPVSIQHAFFKEFKSPLPALDNLTLPSNELKEIGLTTVLPTDYPTTNPYWLNEPSEKGMFQVSDQEQIGLPENNDAIHLVYHLNIEGVEVSLTTPFQYRWVEPSLGERYKPLEITPEISITFDQEMEIFTEDMSPENEPRETDIPFTIRYNKDLPNGKKLYIKTPESWQTTTSIIEVPAGKKYDEKSLFVHVIAPEETSTALLEIYEDAAFKQPARSRFVIDYEHIPTQSLFPVAAIKLVNIDMTITEERIGYLMGAGDAIPEALNTVGYDVKVLEEWELNATHLFAYYEVVIVGIRAFNTLDRMRYIQPELMEFVKKGGHLIVQYNTAHRLKTDQIGPYPLTLSRDRVTVEEAPVTMLVPEHNLFNFPNKITSHDFEGWVQERGLYFPNKWDAQYTALLSAHDPGEPAREGGLLVTKYGQGTFVYTGYSWFRELPAGIPGAYRIFANIIGYRKHKEENTDTDSEFE